MEESFGLFRFIAVGLLLLLTVNETLPVVIGDVTVVTVDVFWD